MSSTPASPKGWYSRGYLPHLDAPGLLQSVTLHLGDSLPPRGPGSPLRRNQPDDPQRLRRIAALLDAGHGACWLRRPDIARLVEDALLYFDGARYRRLCWVIMPNLSTC
jgi:putative transposase